MRLEDCIKSFSNLTESEQLALIQEIRNRRYVVKASSRKREAAPAKKQRKASVSKISKLASHLSAEDIQKLLGELE